MKAKTKKSKRAAKSEFVGFRIDAATLKGIDACAKKRDRTRSSVIVGALSQFVKNYKAKG